MTEHLSSVIGSGLLTNEPTVDAPVFDPITQVFTGGEVLTKLPNSFSFEFPYGGHVQFISGNACAESIVSAFIADPTSEPDGGCVAERAPLEFVLPEETPAS